MSSDADVRALLRRLKPEKRRRPLKRRAVADLAFLEHPSQLAVPLLYDTTVYIDILEARLPAVAKLAIRGAEVWHSTVTDSELVAACGLLNPDHPGTAEVTKRITGIVEYRPRHRTIAPDREIWLASGLLSGDLARLQGYGHAERRRALNDALIFATARKHGLTVLTRNTEDFDFLSQLDPSGKVLFYKQL